MFNKNKRVTLLTYWTSRYVLTLCIGLIIVSVISALWLRHTTLEYRLEMMEYMSDEMVQRLTDTNDRGPMTEEDIPMFMGRENRFRDIEPIMYVVNTEGMIVSSDRPFRFRDPFVFKDVIDGEENTEKFTAKENQVEYYVVKRKIEVNGELLGWIMNVESKQQLTRIKQEYGQLAILIVTLAIIGWGAIYFLSKRLARPIKLVAEAAKQVQDGKYEINLPTHIKEREVYELVTSFKEMAIRLEQLEKTRTELLAGVTHELKTPVTAISGLLQAMKDGVVSGQEADEFLKMALGETTKMKTMVGDLLAFNTFAVDAVPVQIGTYDADEVLADAIAQWEALQINDHITVQLHLLQKKVNVSADLVRVQQIVTNLLTNAQQAISGKGSITITLVEKNEYVSVRVQDTGVGISKEDQPFVFERFYRGENKKYTIRGLGLGLPLSKMMAQSIKGNLNLIESSENGSSFELLLRKEV